MIVGSCVTLLLFTLCNVAILCWRRPKRPKQQTPNHPYKVNVSFPHFFVIIRNGKWHLQVFVWILSPFILDTPIRIRRMIVEKHEFMKRWELHFLVHGCWNSATQKGRRGDASENWWLMSNLFLYMLLFEPFCLKSGDIFYFSVSVSFSLKVVCTSTNRENCVCSWKIFFLTSEIFHALSSYMERFLLQ